MMTDPRIAPYGAWKSPITSEQIVTKTIKLGQIALDGEDIYWTERRPNEGGRTAIVQRTAAGQIRDITPAAFNARSRVHEYGGGSFAVAEGTIYFCNFADQRLYRQSPGEVPQPITPEGKRRYADVVVDRQRGRLICVCEDYGTPEPEPVNTLVSLSLMGNEIVQSLVTGNDFYASPRLSPEGSQLAWLSWNHPNMPWDGTELWVAEVRSDGSLGQREQVAGGDDESVFQPQWSPTGVLYFVSDRTGWWNLYRWQGKQVEPLCELEAEFGQPQWVFGQSTYGFESAERILCTYAQRGSWQLAALETTTGKLEPIALPYSAIASLQVNDKQAVFVASSPTATSTLVQWQRQTGSVTILRRSSDLDIDTGYLSVPEAIEFPTENGLTAHAFFYPPKNKDYAALADERPPLLVKSHGGPTAATSNSLSLKIQYWTSRGIAVLDVNYGGSTGYGRAYCQRLQNGWGIVDVDDCTNGALYLAEQGRVGTSGGGRDRVGSVAPYQDDLGAADRTMALALRHLAAVRPPRQTARTIDDATWCSIGRNTPDWIACPQRRIRV